MDVNEAQRWILLFTALSEQLTSIIDESITLKDHIEDMCSFINDIAEIPDD